MEEEEKQSWNPLNIIQETLRDEGEFYDKTRQQFVEGSAQLADKVVTGGLKKLNVPGAEFIGDRARNITGFVSDVTIPEKEEAAMIGAAVPFAAADPTPFTKAGVALAYGTGVKSRLYRKGTKALSGVLDKVFSLNRVGKEFVDPTTGMKVDPQDATYFMSKGVGDDINPIRSPEVPQQIRQALSQIGSRDGVYDHASHLMYKKTKAISSKESRNIIAFFETDPMKYIRGKGGKILDFDSYSKAQTKKFWDLYGPELSKRGIKRKSIQLHHITSLQASIGLFDGIQWGSREWYDLTSHLAKNFIATGNNPKNLMRITGDALVDKGTPHFLTHKFLDKKVGKQGELFFTTARVEAMKGDWATRLQMADDFSSIVKESEAIAVQTQKAWDLIYGVSEEVPEKLVEFMSQLPANKDYQLPELRELAVQAITDMNLLPKGKKVKLPTQEAILKFIKDGKVRQGTIYDKGGLDPSGLNKIMQESKPTNIPKRKYRKRKKNPDQTELNE